MRKNRIIGLSLVTLLFLCTCSETKTAGIPAMDSRQGEKILNNSNHLFLDVRTDRERFAEYIPNSLHIPIGSLTERIGELSESRNKKIVVYCRSGNRSAKGTAILIKHGYNAVNLAGGMLQWQGPVNKK